MLEMGASWHEKRRQLKIYYISVLVFCISSFKTCEVTGSDQFALALQQSLIDIYNLCIEIQESKTLQTITEQLENNITG